ncbi:MAG: hypothetical protein COB85_04575 [Bacteroidetes bacterium]|nr:MAG: hypothetical protein COB85_04575 [Bacteroidota bacterium]
MRTIFRDPIHQKTFDEDGYVVVPFFDAEQISKLTNLYDSIYDESQSGKSGYHSLFNMDDKEQVANANELIQNVHRDGLQELLIDYKILVSSFSIKEPKTEDYLPLHMDWSIVDETKHISMGTWSPLIDVDLKNGNFAVLKGSHQFGYTIRGSRVCFIYSDEPYPSILGAIKDKYEIECVEMKAGDILFFDHRLAHFSTPNFSDEVRVAAATMLIPEEAQSIHYHVLDDESIEVFETVESFYMSHELNTKPTIGIKSIGVARRDTGAGLQEQMNDSLSIEIPGLEQGSDTALSQH